jgi:(p)ppGpp synthase/HD superfamily hydrolase
MWRNARLLPVAPDRDESPDPTFARELPLTRQAIAFADERHGDQRREADHAPFLIHPLEVASFLERDGYPDHVVAAAVLHDILEDTDAERSELESQFGREVSDLVARVSDDPSVEGEEEQKAEVRERVRHAGGYSPVVYGADKVSKARELRMSIAAGLDTEQAQTKLRRYQKSLEMLEETIPQTRVVELLRFELEALEKLPPG